MQVLFHTYGSRIYGNILCNVGGGSTPSPTSNMKGIVELKIIACSILKKLSFVNYETMKQPRDIGYITFYVDPQRF